MAMTLDSKKRTPRGSRYMAWVLVPLVASTLWATAGCSQSNKPAQTQQAKTPELNSEQAQVTANAAKTTAAADDDTFAEAKSWIQRCFHRHNAPKDEPNMSYADETLRTYIGTRCQHENERNQTQGILARRKAMLAKNGQLDTPKSKTELAEIEEMLARAEAELVKADADIAAIKRGEAPLRPGQTGPRNSLEQHKIDHELRGNFHGAYRDCMSFLGEKLFTIGQYHYAYVQEKPRRSKAHIRKVRKAHIRCRDKAVKAYPAAAELPDIKKYL